MRIPDNVRVRIQTAHAKSKGHAGRYKLSPAMLDLLVRMSKEPKSLYVPRRQSFGMRPANGHTLKALYLRGLIHRRAGAYFFGEVAP